MIRKLLMTAAIVAIALAPSLGIGTAQAHGFGGGFHGGGFHGGGFHGGYGRHFYGGYGRGFYGGYGRGFYGGYGGFYPGYYGYGYSPLGPRSRSPRGIEPDFIERQQTAGHRVRGRLADPHRAVALEEPRCVRVSQDRQPLGAALPRLGRVAQVSHWHLRSHESCS
jgi:hypothetical protein